MLVSLRKDAVTLTDQDVWVGSCRVGFDGHMVGSKDGFWLSGAILLGMALVVGIARPFARSQVNALQTSCSGRARCEAAKGHWVRFTCQGRVEKDPFCCSAVRFLMSLNLRTSSSAA